MSDVSILIPHKRGTENDKALKVALDCILDNTALDYEVLIDATTPRDPYRVYNELAAKATTEYVVMSNSDVFFPPEWLEPMWEARDPDTIVVGIIVECGAIGVHVMNFEMDFGKTPDTYRREQFEAWVAKGGEWRDGEGWYMPCLIHRQTFLEMGGFDLSRGKFMQDELDTMFWADWRDAGKRVKRVRSWCYHLQNYSSQREQNKRK